MTSIIGIIPARYASTRFPGKPLVDLAGKTMIRRVYEQACKAQSLTQVVVATDDARIAEHLALYNIPFVLTDPELPSGTDRCQAAVVNGGLIADYVINIQGDEPLLNPATINQLAQFCIDHRPELATLVKPLTKYEDLVAPTTAKVVLNAKGAAMLFSRQPIPMLRNVPDQKEWIKAFAYLKHIGVYAYRTDILEAITKLGQGVLEQAESLEQLRWLEHGYEIMVCHTNDPDAHGVDTPEDVTRVLELIAAQA